MEAKGIIKKQLVILGIAFVFVCVGLSGCNDDEDEREGIPFIESNFHIYGITLMDSCSSVDPQAPTGTVWVNYTATNYGGRGTGFAKAQIYQGIEEYQWCGNGTIYNQTQEKFITLEQNAVITLSFVFTGVDCTQGIGCYGHKVWFQE